MQHFPIFLNVRDQRIVLSGGGEAAVAKLRLLLKTEASIVVYSGSAAPEIVDWAAQGHIDLVNRALVEGDCSGAALVYAASENAIEDARVASIARAEGTLINIVDNLQDSQFITPAIVDRDPVTIAIGTEGAAPVLARAIKRDLEDRLPQSLGLLARIGKAFRPMAEALPMGRARREFWSEYFSSAGPGGFESDGENGAETALDSLLARHLGHEQAPGHVDFVGAGPGDPDLLTLKARKALDCADVILHDRLIAPDILELARREAILIETGKTGFGPGMTQDEINALIVEHALQGSHVVRLKSGDPTVFGRLDEEIEALEAHDIHWRIVPGITAASAAVAAIGQSLTRRGRNSSVRFLTGHDMQGFADQDWASLSRPGAVAAIYMGKRSARFFQGRMMMHGADPATPVTVIANASRRGQITVASDLAHLTQDLADAQLNGPALTLFGLAPRAALAAIETQSREVAS